MKKNIFLLPLIFSILIAQYTYGSDNGSSDMFPEIRDWELSVNEKVYSPGNLWDIIDGAADAYLSYDFIDLHLADYSKGDVMVHVELYRHGSTNNTFGIYSSERSPDYHFIEIGAEGYSGEGILNFLSGQYYVKIYSTSEGPGVQESLRLIAGEVESSLKQENNWPLELGLLPEPGKLARTERYIAKNFLGFDFLHSAFIADYSDGEDFKIFIIDAGDSGELNGMLEKYLRFTGQSTDLISDSSFVIEDPYNGDILVSVHKDYICGVQDCDDPEFREKYMELLLKNLEH